MQGLFEFVELGLLVEVVDVDRPVRGDRRSICAGWRAGRDWGSGGGGGGGRGGGGAHCL